MMNKTIENSSGDNDEKFLVGRLVGAIDQGTSSSRFLVFSLETSELITYHQVEVAKLCPKDGWVEQNPEDIISSVRRCIEVVVNEKLPALGYGAKDIRLIGLTNQRESTILWDKTTGKALYNSIVWLDNRTSDLVESVIDRLPGRDINWLKNKTGLPISTYFSALKIKWIMENVETVKQTKLEGNLMFGTVDSWLLWNLTGQHLTDVTNASRTLLMDLDTLTWDPFLCDFFKISMSILPKIKSSSDYFGEINSGPLKSIRITGVIGDQSAALVGQKCLNIGQIKVTYGTGAFLMQNIGPAPLHGALKSVSKTAQRKLLTTVAFKIRDQPACYALEGSIAIAGAALTWLRDNLELIENYQDIESIAKQDSSAGGLFFVPAFQGLYAPYWDAYATGTIIGISQFSRKCHLVRATLDGIAYQTNDVLELMQNNLSYGIRIDGGMSSNDLLCQILADKTGNTILRAKMSESTALGAAIIACNYDGLWNNFISTETENECSTPKALQNDNHFNHVNSVDQSYLKNYTAWKPELVWSLVSSFFYPHNDETVSPSRASNFCEPITEDLKRRYDIFLPNLDESERLKRINIWRAAVSRSRKWVRVEQKEQKLINYLRWATLPFTLYVVTSFGLCILSRK